MNKQLLTEYQNPEYMTTELAESVDLNGQKKKDLYMSGIFIQGDVRNRNGRIYPGTEIKTAVEAINVLLKEDISILGEADHPADLKINIDRVSHRITEMRLNGADGVGKLKIIPTPMGNIIRAILESKVKLGVSSRGNGYVNESTGYVSDFQITTVDIVATPSAPNAYPSPIYEGLRNTKRSGDELLEMAASMKHSTKVQKYFQSELTRLIDELRLR